MNLKFLLIVLGLIVTQCFGFYCGTTLIEIGTAQTDVTSACGKPTQIKTVNKEVQGDLCKKETDDCLAVKSTDSAGHDHILFYEKKFIPYEYWIYDLGPTALMQTLSFQNGKVSSVKEGDYGH